MVLMKQKVEDWGSGCFVGVLIGGLLDCNGSWSGEGFGDLNGVLNGSLLDGFDGAGG